MDIAHALKLQGVAATFLHGALPDHKRRANEKVWKEDKVTVMCATKSFCMSIDKPSVKFVHHFDYPENCEDYFQQVSRAGRDGANAICNLLFAIEDRSFHVQNLKALKNEEERSFKMENLNAITEYCMQTTVCRHKILIAYFGEIVHPCEEKCDICIKPTARSSLDKTEEAKIVVECLKELKKKSYKVSLRVLLLTLLGSNAIEIKTKGLNNCQYFGAGKAFSVNAREHKIFNQKIILKLTLDQILTEEFVDRPRKRNTKQDNETRDICLELRNLTVVVREWVQANGLSL